MTIKKILIPVDFSDFSNQALDYALKLANQFQSDIILLHAIVLFQDDVGEEQRLQEYEDWINRREKSIQTNMDSSKAKAATHGLEVETVVSRGVNAADVILEYLDDHPIDLVVMGTHGRTGLKHLLLGSVAEKVVRLSPAPVMTIHRSIREFKVEKILVPIDFSPYSQDAADTAIELAVLFKSSLHLIHVIEQDIHPSFYAAGIESIFQIDKGLKDRVIENLKEFLAAQLPPDLKTEYIVKEGKAHKEIVEYSKESGVDLIVIATHGLSGLDYILLGSTTEKVVRWANCPVLTVKRRD
ncbi:MAG: universal stress protein [Calditrichaeota bacterium]|nr:universal stress protein [Calditrichota bacterium]RQV98784.1 MAG: universal stress protein [Calditrichota bacterium]